MINLFCTRTLTNIYTMIIQGTHCTNLIPATAYTSSLDMTRLLETPQLLLTFLTVLGRLSVLINLPFWCHSRKPFCSVPIHHLCRSVKSKVKNGSRHLSSPERDNMSILSVFSSVVKSLLQLLVCHWKV